MVDFLKTVPFLSKLSRSLLNRIYYGMEKNSYIKGQKIAKEGEHIDFIYFIKDGLFEITKKLVLKDREETQKVLDNDVIRSLLFARNKDNDNIRIRNNMNVSKTKKTVAKLALIGPGKTVLEDDAINKNASWISIQCKSLKGETLKIKIKTFINVSV